MIQRAVVEIKFALGLLFSLLLGGIVGGVFMVVVILAIKLVINISEV